MNDPILRHTFHWLNCKPHWLRSGRGQARLELQAHRTAQWVSLDATELSLDTNSSKRVMLTLDKADAIILRDFLNEVLS